MIPKKVVAEVEVGGWKFERTDDGMVHFRSDFMRRRGADHGEWIPVLTFSGDLSKDEWERVCAAMRGEPVPCSPTCKVGPQGGCTCPVCVPGNTP